jgi:hypothetical protein
MSGGVELVRIDFWNSSTKAYYGYATFTANDTYPTTKIDAYFELGGATARTTQTVDYTPGATNTFVSHVGGDESSVRTKLPTETVKGSINVTINCTAFYLDDVMLAIKQFVRNPLTAGDYVFSADGVDETVTITAPSGRGTVVRDGWWYVDTNGDHICDDLFAYGIGTDTPLFGDIDQDGEGDSIIVRDGWWYVDTDHDNIADEIFAYGIGTDTPLVGDIDQDGATDTIIVRNGWWFVDTDYDHIARDGWWYIDTDYDHSPNDAIAYGLGSDIPLAGDIDFDGSGDMTQVRNGWWFVDSTYDGVVDYYFAYGLGSDIPLVRDMG